MPSYSAMDAEKKQQLVDFLAQLRGEEQGPPPE
jgi:hypothetical protein